MNEEKLKKLNSILDPIKEKEKYKRQLQGDRGKAAKEIRELEADVSVKPSFEKYKELNGLKTSYDMFSKDVETLENEYSELIKSNNAEIKGIANSIVLEHMSNVIPELESEALEQIVKGAEMILNASDKLRGSHGVELSIILDELKGRTSLEEYFDPTDYSNKYPDYWRIRHKKLTPAYFDALKTIRDHFI